MVELNHRDRTIRAKIVYYGPAVCGKTTNLHLLHQHAVATRRSELVSVNSAQDRTILFDLLPLRAQGFRGFELKLHVVAVPGQAMYAATRRLVLKGADAVVFVANSATDRWEETVQSFREMAQSLVAHELDPATMPMVLQYNKRDLPDLIPIDFMDRTLNARHVDALPAVAVRGEGVLETFAAALRRCVGDLAARYQIVDAARGQDLDTWVRQAVLGMFRVEKFVAGPPLPDLPDRRMVRIALPDDVVRLASATPDARANETLVESYAQAATRLSTALDEVRDQRDKARQRLAVISEALEGTVALARGDDTASVLSTLLPGLGRSLGMRLGSVLRRGAEGRVQPVAVFGMREDPFASRDLPWAAVAGDVASGPRIVHTREPNLVADALRSARPQLAGAVVIPVGGTAVALYQTFDDVPPEPEDLLHVRAAAALLAVASTPAGQFDLALVGAAAPRALQEARAALELSRDRLADLAAHPDLPPFAREELTEVILPIAKAADSGAALEGLAKGVVEWQALELAELTTELLLEGVEVLAQGARVRGDAPLLRVALLTLVDALRGPLGQEPVSLAAETGEAAVAIRLSAPSPAALLATDMRLALAARIAELHGGNARLTRAPGGGTMVTMTLPRG